MHLPSFSTGPVQMTSTMALSLGEIKINLHCKPAGSFSCCSCWVAFSHPPTLSSASLPPTCLDHFPLFPSPILVLTQGVPTACEGKCSSLPISLPPFQPCAHASGIGTTPGWLPQLPPTHLEVYCILLLGWSKVLQTPQLS